MQFKNYFLIISLLLFLFSCKNVEQGELLAFDDIIYCGDEFGVVDETSDGTLIKHDILGALSFVVKDSILIVSSQDAEGYWSMFMLPEMKPLGKYIRKGRGQNELNSIPHVKHQSFYEKDGELFASIYDFSSGQTFDMNVTRTAAEKTLVMEKGEQLPRTLFCRMKTGDTTFGIEPDNTSHTQVFRFLYNDGKREITPAMERLNRFALEPGADINALSSQHGIKSDGSRIVEAYRRIDQINLYSPDGKLCKTITAAKKLQSPHSVSPRGDRMLYYRDIKTTDDYFAVLYLKDKESRIEKGKNKAPTIQFFYWNGKPMAELTLNKPVSTFEIDEKGGLLYTLDDTTEQMYMYDISGFINILNQIKKASK